MSNGTVTQQPARADDDSERLSYVSRLKGAGYLTSTVSVILLAIPGLKTAIEDPAMLGCLVVGALASVCGMFLRWRSHRAEQKKQGD